MAKIKSTVFPMGPVEPWKPNNLTIGAMEHHWTMNGTGHFNKDLYERISAMRVDHDQVTAYNKSKKDEPNND